MARVISDRGTAFNSRVFESFGDSNGICHVKVASGTPKANAQVERTNRTLLYA